MKKISIILVMLFWCNVSFAGCIQGNCKNGQGTWTLADGTTYAGEWKNGKMHGQGTLTAADGSKYIGEFKDDKIQRQGTYTPTTYSYEEALLENMEQYKKTWWDSIVWFFEDLFEPFEDLFESDESEKDKEITELRKRIKRLESNRGTANEIRELKKCVQDISMGLPCYPY